MSRSFLEYSEFTAVLDDITILSFDEAEFMVSTMLNIPRIAYVVVTGSSGSGKSYFSHLFPESRVVSVDNHGEIVDGQWIISWDAVLEEIQLKQGDHDIPLIIEGVSDNMHEVPADIFHGVVKVLVMKPDLLSSQKMNAAKAKQAEIDGLPLKWIEGWRRYADATEEQLLTRQLQMYFDAKEEFPLTPIDFVEVNVDGPIDEAWHQRV